MDEGREDVFDEGILLGIDDGRKVFVWIRFHRLRHRYLVWTDMVLRSTVRSLFARWNLQSFQSQLMVRSILCCLLNHYYHHTNRVKTFYDSSFSFLKVLILSASAIESKITSKADPICIVFLVNALYGSTPLSFRINRITPSKKIDHATKKNLASRFPLSPTSSSLYFKRFFQSKHSSL